MSSGQAWDSVSPTAVGAPQNDLQEKLLEVANRAKNFTAAAGAAIAVTVGGKFVVSVTCGTSLAVGAPVPVPSTFGGFRKEKGNVLRFADTDKEATLDGEACRAARIKSMLVAPIGELSSVVGVLAVFSSAVNAFTDTHVAVVKTLAEVISHLLPDKQQLSDSLPGKKVGELLEHPFNPAIDNVSRAAEGAALAHDQVPRGEDPMLLPTAAPLTDNVLSAPARPPAAPAWIAPPSPAPEKRPAPAAPKAPPEVHKKPTPPTKRPRVTPSFASAAKAAGSVPRFASDPLSKSSWRKSTSGNRSAVFPSMDRISAARDSKTLYVGALILLTAVAFAWGGYDYLSNKKVTSVEVPPTVAISTPPSRTTPLSSRPATQDRTPPVKSDVVPTATAASLPEKASPPPVEVAHSSAPHSAKSTSPAESYPVVVMQAKAPAAVPALQSQEESVEEVHVLTAKNENDINDILKNSTAAPAPTPTLRTANVVPSELISRVPPVYPDNAKRFGIQGTVVISAKITKEGTVTDLRPVSGNTILCEAAMDAIKKWRYKPALSDGQPIDSTTEIAINFKPSR